MNLLKGIKMEYSKVQWPKKAEIKHATLWVVIMSSVLSLYLGVFDIIASRLLKLLTSIIGG
ncbi:MAG: preprotein translocase subunit SecE [Fusobacteriaceae bacterium]